MVLGRKSGPRDRGGTRDGFDLNHCIQAQILNNFKKYC